MSPSVHPPLPVHLRVISLLASATEIVCALGAGNWLVGRSHECDNPAWVSDLPQCSRPAFDVSGSSAAIDAEVRRRIRTGEPLYILDEPLIRSLQPHLVIAQEHCDVCAVTAGDVDRCTLGNPMQVMALSAGTLSGIFDGIQRVARALDLERAGLALIKAEQARFDRVRIRCASYPSPSVVLVEWIDPLFTMGNWGPELLELANGRSLIGVAGQHSHALSWNEVRAANPDVLIVAPCGFTLSRALAERSTLESLPGWSGLCAVRSGRVAFADGNLYFNRSGTTVTRSAEILAEMLHGEVFGERTEGTAWRWL